MNVKHRWLYAVLAALSLGAHAQGELPNDPEPTCTVTEREFKSWFASGQVTAGGLVTPADSVTFPHRNNCDFHVWSERMFLWLTSQAAHSYGNGGIVLESPVFFGVSDTADGKRSFVPHVVGQPRRFQMFRAQAGANGASVGQAGSSGVLMAQSGSNAAGSLVYYNINVNDVYKYFLTEAKKTASTVVPPPYPNFPTSLKDLEFGGTKPPQFPDLKALTMEIKTSWVEADKLRAAGFDPSTYVLMDALIPTFDTSNASKWVENGEKRSQLALVGIHVVGSANGHPEMIWATFEHKDNAPNNGYAYRTNKKQIAWVGTPATGKWLFTGNNTSVYNQQNMEAGVSGNKMQITPTAGNQISPSSTLRMSAWGTGPNNPAFVVNNTEVISINNSILSLLKAGDVRRNYLFVGSTWTKDGQTPTVTSNQIGTNLLANATMETYVQFPTNTTNCFSCHQGPSSNGLYPGADLPGYRNALSHIFGTLQP